MDAQPSRGTRPSPSLFARLFPAVMDARDLYARRARAWGVLAAVVLALGLAVAKDEVGVVFVVAFAAFFGLRSFWNVRKLRQARAGEQVAMNVDGLPPAERAPALRRIMWIGGAATAFLAAWTAWELWAVESGQVESADVWGPVALVYRTLGFWPAVLTLPVLGVLIVTSARTKLRNLERAGPWAGR